MSKAIVVNQELCNGCQLCQVGCVVKKTDQAGLQPARIRVDNLFCGGTSVILCHHCIEPLCTLACSMEAITKDNQGLTVRDQDLCLGCQACVVICPWGAVVFDDTQEIAVSCDFCGGEPVCVSLCPTGALQLIDTEKMSLTKRQITAERMATVGGTVTLVMP